VAIKTCPVNGFKERSATNYAKGHEKFEKIRAIRGKKVSEKNLSTFGTVVSAVRQAV